MRALTRVLVCALVLTGLAAVRSTPSEAAAAPPQSYVTMFSEPHEFIGEHLAQSWRSGEDSITISGSVADLIEINVKDGSGGWYRLEFAAPPGQQLQAGTYLNAERAVFRSPGHPGIDIAGNGNGCHRVSGQFRVLDIAPDLSRLWLVYEHHCERGPGALFGEISIGMPVVDPRVSVDGGQVVWPDEYVGRAGRPAEVPITSRSNVSVPIGEAAVTGEGFELLGSTCPATLPPGGHCTLTVGFKPSAVGTRQGALTVVVNGRVRRVLLEGAGFLPTAVWLTQGDPGEHLGNALAELSVDGVGGYQGAVDGYGTSSKLGMTATDDLTEGVFRATFEAPAGQQLLPGTTFSGAMKYPSTSPSVPGMDVTAWGSTCDTVSGSFTIRSATYDGQQVTSFIIDFVQHCNGAAPAYRGSLYWNTGGRPAAQATATGIAAAPVIVGHGSPTSISGTLRRSSSAQPVPGARVLLYSRQAGSNDWRYRSSSLTAADGRYSFAMTPSRNVDVRVHHPGTLTTVASRSAPLRVWVRPRVALTAARTEAPVGVGVRLRARVGPARPGQVVVLQRYVGGAWRTVQRTTQPSTGPAVFVVRLPRRGWYTFRARTPADTSLAAGLSVSRRVRAF